VVDTEYGAGIKLTQNFDFDISPTGDIESTDGVAELEKDLAFQLTRVLNDEVGEVIGPGSASQLERLTRVALNQDARVSEVLSVQVDLERGDRALISASLDAGDAVEEFVFEV
jgi:hypothetical protein